MYFTKLMHDLEGKQDMLNILTIAVRQIIHGYIQNLKHMSNINFLTRGLSYFISESKISGLYLRFVIK